MSNDPWVIVPEFYCPVHKADLMEWTNSSFKWVCLVTGCDQYEIPYEPSFDDLEVNE